MGISDVKVLEVDPTQQDIPQEVLDVIRKIVQRQKDSGTANIVQYKVDFTHQMIDTDSTVEFSFEEESRGTRRFFSLIGPWIDVLSFGFTVCVDELEASLHPLLTQRLIEFIHDIKLNRKGSQLIFSTHDTTLLDPELLRRDQIYFTEKGEDGATRLYSLGDYKERAVRKGEALQKGYLAGRYGAIPIIEKFEKVAAKLNDT